MDQYHMINKIGSGSFGEVWRALTEHTNEVVAIKKLKMKCKSVEDCINLGEIEALQNLNHPNIVMLKQVIKEYDTVILVFECMECSLHDRIYDRMIKKKYFSEDEIMNMCFQIFQGLAHMHERGYFHRDLKPENLLVSGNVIKIADFGFARKSNGKPPFDHVGTPLYSAPEVLLYARQYDYSVDMWAMGAIMAELFAGKPLFLGDGTGDQLYEICSVIGSPTENIWSVGLEQLASNIGYRFPQLPGVHLSSLIPSASPEAINLIATLLSWSPYARPTAKEALEHPFFYSRYSVPPPLCGQPMPVVFKLAAKREFEMEMKRRDCAFGMEQVGSREDVIHLLPRSPLITSSDLVDSTEDLLHLLPENPFY